MKHLILSAFGLIAGSAVAQPLAILKQFGGYCPGTCPTTTVILDDSGLVTVESQQYSEFPVTETTSLLTLNEVVLNAIKHDISNVTETSLQDLNPSGPFCTDIPVKVYTVIKDGKKIKIGEDKECHSFRLSTFAATEVASTLNNFLALYNYTEYTY